MRLQRHALVTSAMVVAMASAGLPASAQQAPTFQPGTYRCIASKLVGGTLQMTARGAVAFARTGGYSYKGFAKPSEGSWKQQPDGALALKGGYLDGGEATPIAGYANRYYLVFPTNPDHRWTCSLAAPA